MDIQLSNALIRDAISRLKLQAPAPNDLHLVGIRGAVPISSMTIRTGSNQPDHYDDTIACFGTELQAYRGSVDPGLFYTKKPLNPEGCAHLINGGPYRFKRGLHKGHPALRQAEPFPFWRDADRDTVRDATSLEAKVRREMIGLDLHAGGTSTVVGPHSAACQVIHGGYAGKPWQEFYDTCSRSGQRTFLYWLLNAQDLIP